MGVCSEQDRLRQDKVLGKVKVFHPLGFPGRKGSVSLMGGGLLCPASRGDPHKH